MITNQYKGPRSRLGTRISFGAKAALDAICRDSDLPQGEAIEKLIDFRYSEIAKWKEFIKSPKK